MVRRNLTIAIVFALLTSLAIARAQRYPTFVPPPPGTVVQNVSVYLSGEMMSSRWQAITSKRLVGREMGGTPVYQWWLSMYSPPNGDRAQLTLRSPGSSDLLPPVKKAPNAQMYFPIEDIRVIGGAELERPQVQDAVTVSHVQGADCGMATVAIVGADERFHTSVRARVDNFCALDAAIVRDGDLQAVRLTGPYYQRNSPVCCPAKPRVSALLRYRGGKWTITPAYFALQRARRP